MSSKSLPAFHLRPAHGTCRWIDRGCGVLQINGVRYTVIRVAGRYRLLNWDNGNVYDIGADQQCSCPSFIWDHCPVQAGGDGCCKHIAALRRLGLLLEPAPLGRSA
jgi:hypothetical protein